MVISELRRAASRANGAKSRGAVTPAGKKRCSKNAVKHGGYADPDVAINNGVHMEDQSELDRRRDELIEAIGGEDPMDRAIARGIARGICRRDRIEMFEDHLLAGILAGPKPYVPDWREETDPDDDPDRVDPDAMAPEHVLQAEHDRKEWYEKKDRAEVATEALAVLSRTVPLDVAIGRDVQRQHRLLEDRRNQRRSSGIDHIEVDGADTDGVTVDDGDCGTSSNDSASTQDAAPLDATMSSAEPITLVGVPAVDLSVIEIRETNPSAAPLRVRAGAPGNAWTTEASLGHGGRASP